MARRKKARQQPQQRQPPHQQATRRLDVLIGELSGPVTPAEHRLSADQACARLQPPASASRPARAEAERLERLETEKAALQNFFIGDPPEE